LLYLSEGKESVGMVPAAAKTPDQFSLSPAAGN